MIPQPIKIAAISLAVIIVGTNLLMPNNAQSLSLATDAGLKDEDVCDAVAARGPDAVARLEASGFPRASTNDVETYRLQKNGVTQAAIRIDWTQRTAACINLDDASAPTVNVRMGERAYGLVVAEIKHALDTGETTGWNFWNAVVVLNGTTITLPQGGNAFAYKSALAKWTAGFLATNGDAKS